MRNPSAFNVNALVRRGWMMGLIAKVLGAEDDLAPNVQFPRDDRPMRLYARNRVLAAEQGAEFLKAQQRRARKVEKERRRSPEHYTK